MNAENHAQPFYLKDNWLGNIVFGLITLSIGVVLAYIAYDNYSGANSIIPELSGERVDVFFGIFGGVLILVGLPSIFKRKGYKVYPSNRTICHVKKGIFGTKLSDEILFADLTHVQVARVTRSSNDSERTYFPVVIHLKSGESREIFWEDRYPHSRRCAETISRLADVDFYDDSEPGGTQVRTPEELDQTVGEKLAKKSADRSQPSKPVLTYAKVIPGTDSLRIEIPRVDLASFGPMRIALWILFAVFGGGAAAFFYYGEIVFGLFCSFVVAAFLYLILRSESITLTRDALIVREGISFIKWPRQIPFSELEELLLLNATAEEDKEADQLLESGQVTKEIHRALEAFVALGSAIVARSDSKSISIGRVLSNAELDHLLYQMESWIKR